MQSHSLGPSNLSYDSKMTCPTIKSQVDIELKGSSFSSQTQTKGLLLLSFESYHI